MTTQAPVADVNSLSG